MGLVITDVTKRFGDHLAVDHLSLKIPSETIYGFLGGNGAGKTTTFRMILGLLEQTTGEITWNNAHVGYDQSHLIGYLPEERGLYPKLTVKEQIIYLGRLRGMRKPAILEALDMWLDRFHVSDYLDKKIEELSKGNQQKIQFISAVIHQPKLLILDEPFSGLDPINLEMLKEAVVDLKEQKTSIVFSSHQMEHVEALCENICILSKGQAVVEGSLKEIKQSFGRQKLVIHGDQPLAFLKEMAGVLQYTTVPGGCELQIADEAVSQNVFNALQNKGFIRKFELAEPRLKDIFIAKVGATYE